MASTPPLDFYDAHKQLNRACAANNFEAGRQVITSVINTLGISECKRLLLTEDDAGATPMHKAHEATGRSETGDPALKLLILSYIVQLGAITDICRDGPYELLPMLGLLMPLGGHHGSEGKGEQQLLVDRAIKVREAALNDGDDDDDDDGSVMDEVRMKKEITVEVRNKWLTIYANLPHEGIGLGVAYEFVKEYDEREKWVKLQAWTNERSTIDKPSALGGALLRNVELVQDAQQAAIHLRASQRNIEAEKFDQLSERLQVVPLARAVRSVGTGPGGLCGSGGEGGEWLGVR